MPSPSHSPTAQVHCCDIPQLFSPEARCNLLRLQQRRQPAVVFCMEFWRNCTVLTNSMEHRSTWEAYRLSVGPEIPHSSWKQEVHFCVYWSLQSAVHFKEIRKLCSCEQKFNTNTMNIRTCLLVTYSNKQYSLQMRQEKTIAHNVLRHYSLLVSTS